MNINSYAEEKPSVDFGKWLFGTIFSVTLGGLLTLIVGLFFHLSFFVGGVVLWLTTTLFSYWAQSLATRSTFRARIPHLLFWLLVSSAIGWTISLLVIYPLFHFSDSALWRGFFAGGTIGLFPGSFTCLAYYWRIRPYNDALYLSVINALGWCVGMGFAATLIFWLINRIANSFPIFLEFAGIQ